MFQQRAYLIERQFFHIIATNISNWFHIWQIRGGVSVSHSVTPELARANAKRSSSWVVNEWSSISMELRTPVIEASLSLVLHVRSMDLTGDFQKHVRMRRLYCSHDVSTVGNKESWPSAARNIEDYSICTKWSNRTIWKDLPLQRYLSTNTVITFQVAQSVYPHGNLFSMLIADTGTYAFRSWSHLHFKFFSPFKSVSTAWRLPDHNWLSRSSHHESSNKNVPSKSQVLGLPQSVTRAENSKRPGNRRNASSSNPIWQ